MTITDNKIQTICYCKKKTIKAFFLNATSEFKHHDIRMHSMKMGIILRFAKDCNSTVLLNNQGMATLYFKVHSLINKSLSMTFASNLGKLVVS